MEEISQFRQYEQAKCYWTQYEHGCDMTQAWKRSNTSCFYMENTQVFLVTYIEQFTCMAKFSKFICNIFLQNVNRKPKHHNLRVSTI